MQVFAIAGPAMMANLTTPLIGIVSTTDILAAVTFSTGSLN